jgi:hypothetical protein
MDRSLRRSVAFVAAADRSMMVRTLLAAPVAALLATVVWAGVVAA